MSVDLGCSDDVLTIVSMISVENIFYRPRERQEAADMQKERFNQPEGDHLTLLAIYNGWRRHNCSPAWCVRTLCRIGRCEGSGHQEAAAEHHGPQQAGGEELWQASAADPEGHLFGYFRHAAKRDKEGYRTMTDDQKVYMHPSSSLFKSQPLWVVYHEVVMTTREYMRRWVVVGVVC